MRIGIYGGTFDPPHNGHVSALKAFTEQFDFDKIFIIPVLIPPHKSRKSTVSAEDRLNMSDLAFKNLSKIIEISDLEINRQGKSYTADTIREIKNMGYDDIYFLCGTDMLLTLDSWYMPEYIFANATIVYARRECDERLDIEISEKIQNYQAKFNAKIIPLKTQIIEISSSEIRESLDTESRNRYLPSEVADYIINHGLYKDVSTI